MIQYYFQINPPSVNVSIQTDSEFANQSMCYLKTKTITYWKLNALPVKNVVIQDVHVDKVNDFVKKVHNVKNVKEDNVTYGSLREWMAYCIIMTDLKNYTN